MTISRRQMLAGSAAATATITAIGATHAAASTVLAQLIVTHRTAYDVYADACAVYGDIDGMLMRSHKPPISEKERCRLEAEIPAVEDRIDETADVELTASVDLAAYRPISAAEAQTKAAYIESSPPFHENNVRDDFRPALIAKLCEVEGAGS
jgi:hypothetical protein